MDTEQKLDNLSGRVDCLLAFVSAAMQTHCDLPALQASLASAMEAQEAVTLPATVSEEFVSGQAQMRGRLRELMRAAVLRRA